MRDPEPPIYVSPRSPRSFWQEYRIYPDRIELQSRFTLRTLRIPLGEIVAVEVRPALVLGDWFRGRSFAFSAAFKLDWADCCEHVALTRASGRLKYLRFTPDEPSKFVEIVQGLI